MAVKESSIKKKRRWTRDDTELTMLALPTTIWYFLFAFLPMFGIIIAFKKYQISGGFLNSIITSDWIGLDNFKFLFSAGDIWIIPVSYTHLDVYKRQLWRRSFLFQAADGPQGKARCLNCLLHYLLELPDTMAAFIDTFFQWRQKAPKARGHPAPRFHLNRRPPQWQDLQEALQLRKYCVWRRLLRYGFLRRCCVCCGSRDIRNTTYFPRCQEQVYSSSPPFLQLFPQ